jgi:hypothetical protein
VGVDQTQLVFLAVGLRDAAGAVFLGIAAGRVVTLIQRRLPSAPRRLAQSQDGAVPIQLSTQPPDVQIFLHGTG